MHQTRNVTQMESLSESKLQIVIIIGVTIILLVAGALWLWPGTQRTVFVNSARIVDGYKSTPLVREEIKTSTAVWRANVDSLAMEIHERIKAIEAERPTLSSREWKPIKVSLFMKDMNC